MTSQARRIIKRWQWKCQCFTGFIRWRVLALVQSALYRSAVNHLSWWPLAWVEREPRRHGNGERRIVYYLWFFPTLSETFIQRELAALIKAEIRVEIVAHQGEDQELLGPEARALTERTQYLERIGRLKLVGYAGDLFWRGPVHFINAVLYILFCKYDSRKSLALDLGVLARSIHLARVLKEKRADHVHAPWASIDAFVAMVAASFLRIPYTVQARAYDIHRHASAVGLPAKLANADFVITNSRYNQSKLKSVVPSESREKIHAIYNGIELSRFQPDRGLTRNRTPIKVLSVANLVEPKGLEYLIMACRILRARGYRVSCEIIGGRVVTDTNYYIKLKKLRKRFALENDVFFLGRQPFDYVLKKYNEADIFVLPAVVAEHGGRDITPNVLIEAMAMKLPVVSTLSGAIPEIVDDGVSGILVPPRDEEALVQAIIRLLGNPALAEELGTNARQKVEERFNINKNISQFVALFRAGYRAPCVSSLARPS
jgi:colanic acid/amylovoran biosynthesis glycosyltransferase